LISSKDLETAIVTATLKDVPGATDSLTVRFDPPDTSTVISISTSKREVPADGATVIQVHADIASSIPEADRTVTFTTTEGTFVNSSTPTQTTDKADASNRATVDLKAGTEIVTAVLRATASVASAETTVQFVRAFPEAIQVDFGTAASLKGDGTSSVTVKAKLLRDVGTVTDNTVVEFSAVDAATKAPVALLFRNVQRSTNGEATALVIAPTTTPRTTVTIQARVQREDGTFVTGEANIAIVD
jgi:hypothetical protein